ncbi:MAG: RadC family protein [Candidatus Saccharibacteria bacterium]
MRYRTTIKELPEDLRPRERLAAKGEDFLNDAELLAILLGSGTREMSAIELAENIIKDNKGLRFAKNLSLQELGNIKGIGLAKATRIKAAVELGKRLSERVSDHRYISSPEDVKNLVMEDMRYLDREQFRCMYLGRKNQVLATEIISIGGLASSPVHPREVFKSAIKRSAASVILIHNHPSGDPAPSTEDIDITRRLIESGKLLGIDVLDHIIVGDGKYVSMKSTNII